MPKTASFPSPFDGISSGMGAPIRGVPFPAPRFTVPVLAPAAGMDKPEAMAETSRIGINPCHGVDRAFLPSRAPACWQRGFGHGPHRYSPPPGCRYTRPEFAGPDRRPPIDSAYREASLDDSHERADYLLRAYPREKDCTPRRHCHGDRQGLFGTEEHCGRMEAPSIRRRSPPAYHNRILRLFKGESVSRRSHMRAAPPPSPLSGMW